VPNENKDMIKFHLAAIIVKIKSWNNSPAVLETEQIAARIIVTLKMFVDFK